jgi:predicted nucleic acid-binding protein
VVVIDASVLVDVVLRNPTADSVRHALRRAGGSLHAPHLIYIEVAQVLRRYEVRGYASPERCRTAMADLMSFRLTGHLHDRFLARIWELRHNLTAYDAAYVALAEALGAVLLTRDRKIATAPGHRARVELV